MRIQEEYTRGKNTGEYRMNTRQGKGEYSEWRGNLHTRGSASCPEYFLTHARSHSFLLGVLIIDFWFVVQFFAYNAYDNEKYF